MPNRPTAIAFDFDGTLSEDTGVWRGAGVVGEPIENVIAVARWCRQRDWLNLLWSCRGDNGTLQEFCAKHGIPMQFINENPFWEKGRGDNPHKIKADCLVDDKNVNPFIRRVAPRQFRILTPDEVDIEEVMAEIDAALELRRRKVEGTYYGR